MISKPQSGALADLRLTSGSVGTFSMESSSIGIWTFKKWAELSNKAGASITALMPIPVITGTKTSGSSPRRVLTAVRLEIEKDKSIVLKSISVHSTDPSNTTIQSGSFTTSIATETPVELARFSPNTTLDLAPSSFPIAPRKVERSLVVALEFYWNADAALKLYSVGVDLMYV